MEFVATVALRTLLPKLAQLLQDEYKLQKSARKGIEDLCKELEAMDVFLCKVGEVTRDQLDEQHKIWAREVRDLSYDMEDMVDTFMVDIEGPDAPSSKSTFRKFFSKMKEKVNKAMTRREIAKEIMDIKERVIEVADRHKRYNFDANTPHTKKTTVDPRITSLYTDVTELVGIDEAKKEVITRLTEGGVDQQQKNIISIAGFGGLGKTTLARAVFNEIQGQFNCKAFVSVSRNPDINKLLKGILYELHNGGDGNNFPGANLDETTQLIDLIRKSLQNKRYLIVVDDIWEIESWTIILCALDIKNSMGSRIITTTRIIGLAEQVGGCYRLQPLTKENSKKLFYGRIFGEDKCPEQFYEVSKKIPKKCGGVPLAIVTTSSLLANKLEKNIKDWNAVCDSIGLGFGSNHDMDIMRNILMLSYYDLPSDLKTCLLYLSIFPEDYVIRKDPLIWKWVAEGFVQRKHEEQSYLECGENYFNELINRSLIQPVNMDAVEGTAEACRVHDMVLDLIISLSKDKCFITTVSGGKYSVESKEVRRLSLHDDTSGWHSMNMPKLRSLTIFKAAALVIVPTPSLSCHLLRVLDIGSQGVQLKDLESLRFLGSLSHLRYLRLPSESATKYVKRLPEEIGKLRFLQTLDLSKTKVGELPSSFTGLTQLKCLRGYPALERTRLPDGLVKNLTSLEVLEGVTVTSECFAEELGLLTGLMALDVKVVELPEDGLSLQACGETMAESLGKLHKIESLSITNDYDTFKFVMDGSVEPPLGNLRRVGIELLRTLPTWINGASLPALSYLDVTVFLERREDIHVLGTLSCLRHLKFNVCQRREQAQERWSEVGPCAFPNAISCNFLGRNTTVQGVVPSLFLGGAMPRLQDYKFNINLEDMCGNGALYTVDDLALAHLPSLRSVTVHTHGGGGYGNGALKEVWRVVREKLEREAAAHPNHPPLDLINWN